MPKCIGSAGITRTWRSWAREPTDKFKINSLLLHRFRNSLPSIRQSPPSTVADISDNFPNSTHTRTRVHHFTKGTCTVAGGIRKRYWSQDRSPPFLSLCFPSFSFSFFSILKRGNEVGGSVERRTPRGQRTKNIYFNPFFIPHCLSLALSFLSIRLCFRPSTFTPSQSLSPRFKLFPSCFPCTRRFCDCCFLSCETSPGRTVVQDCSSPHRTLRLIFQFPRVPRSRTTVSTRLHNSYRAGR